MNATDITDRAANEVMRKLNSYEGDNVWEDVIYGLDYNEAATDVLTGGVETGDRVAIDLPDGTGGDVPHEFHLLGVGVWECFGSFED